MKITLESSRKLLFAVKHTVKRKRPAGHLVVTQMRFPASQMHWAACHHLICARSLSSQIEISVRLQRKWSCHWNRRWWRLFCVRDVISLDKVREQYSDNRTAVFIQQHLFSELSCMSLRVVVAKHLGANTSGVDLFFLSFRLFGWEESSCSC